MSDQLTYNSGYTMGNVVYSPYQEHPFTNGLGQSNKGFDAQQLQQFMQATQEKKMALSGNKPIIVCGGEVKEAKDMDDAQAIAESLAHSKSADAYILKPVKKVAPKRDVVTTDLA